MEWIGIIPTCHICNDNVQYEGKNGLMDCHICCSRLIPFIDYTNSRQYINVGQTLIKEDGIHIVETYNT